MSNDISFNDNIVIDEIGVVRHIQHSPKSSSKTKEKISLMKDTPQLIANEYIKEMAPTFGIKPELLTELGKQNKEKVKFQLNDAGEKILFSDEKQIMNTHIISYVHTFNEIPIFQSGLSVTINDGMGVVSSQNSVHSDLQIQMPSENAEFLPQNIDVEKLKDILNIQNSKTTWTKISINSKRLLIYQFKPELRITPQAYSSGDDEKINHNITSLPIPSIHPTIKSGKDYVISEILFTSSNNERNLNWKTFIEVETGSVLYLRALIAHAYTNAHGLIYENDPCTTTGNESITPSSSSNILDPLRKYVTLMQLENRSPRKLYGKYVRLVDIDRPLVDPPEETSPGKFFYSVPTDNFAAVNAYYHCDSVFRMVERMGFDISEYFDGSNIPVPVDHRSNLDDLEDCPEGNCVNAAAPGNLLGQGSDGFVFGLVAEGAPVGIAVDKRVVLHEFGHVLLWDCVHSPNFGFAHSAGDSLAAILSDPLSSAPDRYQTFPWITLLRDRRRHDRAISDGWAWRGPHYEPFRGNDRAGYKAEQILSTTLFRIYRSLGGDSSSIGTKKFAANYIAYLIIRAIGSLATDPITPTETPEVFATALMNADLGTTHFEGFSGGFLHKVIRWGFEKQGLYQLPGTPLPIRQEGKPPEVDIFIDDGRNGEYSYKKNFWNTNDIWNRRLADKKIESQPPEIGKTNYIYTRIKNRGRKNAKNVIVKAFFSKSSVGLFPEDWQIIGTIQLNENEILPNSEIIVGPFEWIPDNEGDQNIIISVSADGDLSNIDISDRSFPIWLLVPFDNNIAQKNMKFMPEVQATKANTLSTIRHAFEISNPHGHNTNVSIKSGFEFLNIKYLNNGGDKFILKPNEVKEILLDISLSDDDDIKLSDKSNNFELDISVLMDDQEVGGTTLKLK
jgi:hypothetical protein